MLSGQVEPIPAAAAALGAAQEHAREAGSLLGSDAEEATSSQARPCQGFAKVAEDGSMQHQPDVHRVRNQICCSSVQVHV